MSQPLLAHVALVTAGRVVVVASEPAQVALLVQLGAAAEGSGRLVFACDDEAELAAVLTALRDAGVPFAGAPHGWPPAEVFAHLREKGLVHGPFREVRWLAPEQTTTVLR